MPSPSTSLATQRPELAQTLEEFDLDMNRNGFIAQRVLPVKEVSKQAGTFGKIPIAQLLQKRETARAPGSGYNRGTFTFTTDSWACQEHGAEEPVDDRESGMYADYFEQEIVCASRAREVVMRNYEQRTYDLFAALSTSSDADTLNEWDDPSNATPLTAVEAAVQEVYASSGIWPNTLVMNRKQFRHLRNVDQIIDRVKYQNNMDVRAGNITVSALEQAFDLRIVVGGSSENTADEGVAASISQIWDDEYVFVVTVPTGSDMREPCTGRTFHWADDGSTIGTTLESYRDETVRADVIRARHDVDEKILMSTTGLKLDNILASS